MNYTKRTFCTKNHQPQVKKLKLSKIKGVKSTIFLLGFSSLYSYYNIHLKLVEEERKQTEIFIKDINSLKQKLLN